MTHSTTSSARSVLLIDDDEDFLAGTRDLLTGAGYDVRSCSTGRQGLEMLADGSYQPYAIIVDLRMPQTDGYAFLAACEVEPRLRDVAVIVVSAYGDPTGIEYDFLPKPVNVSRLLRTLEKVGSRERVAL